MISSRKALLQERLNLAVEEYIPDFPPQQRKQDKHRTFVKGEEIRN